MKSVSPSRTLVCAVLILSILCLALTGVLIWRAFVYEPDSPAEPPENPLDLTWRFPGYFRTPQEQAIFVRQTARAKVMQPVQNVSKTIGTCYQPCYAKSGSTSPAPVNKTVGQRRRRQASSTCALDELTSSGVQLTNHACCVSYATYGNDAYLPSAANSSQMLKIAQGIGNLFQYFETEYCCQISECSICQCEQTHYIITAVIEDTRVRNRYYTDWVKVPGCCKCVN